MCWKGVMDGLEEGKGWVGRANGGGDEGRNGWKRHAGQNRFQYNRVVRCLPMQSLTGNFKHYCHAPMKET